MPADDLTLLKDAALAAGEIAQTYFKRDPEVWHKPDDAGPVTAADLAVDKMLRERLLEARPNYGWLSEETEDDPARLHQDHVFIVDPIDGTRAFIEGAAHWSHSLAIAHNGQITAAAVYLPVNDLLFFASTGGGAFLNDDPIQVTDCAKAEGACVLSAKANFKDDYWPGGFPGIRRSFRSSIAYRLCLVAQGRFDGMLTFRPSWEWDVAAGALIVAEAGGLATDQRGVPALFNRPGCKLDGMIAAGPSLHAALVQGRTGSA